jgi:hypothetical protein
MEVTCSSETQVEFQRTTRRCIPEHRTLHNHRCKNPLTERRKLVTFPNTWFVSKIRKLGGVENLRENSVRVLGHSKVLLSTVVTWRPCKSLRKYRYWWFSVWQIELPIITQRSLSYRSEKRKAWQRSTHLYELILWNLGLHHNNSECFHRLLASVCRSPACTHTTNE